MTLPLTARGESAMSNAADLIAAHLMVCATCDAIFLSHPDEKSEAWHTMFAHVFDSADDVPLEKALTAIEYAQAEEMTD